MEQEPQGLDISTRLSQVESKLEAIYQSTEKTRKYFLYTIVITVVVVLIPLLILPLVLPSFITNITVPAELLQ